MTTTLQRLAAPSPDDLDEDAITDAQRRDDERMHDLCEQLAMWVRTRRLYGAPGAPASVLGRLRSPTSFADRDAPCSAEMAALWIAVVAQPREALDRRVFELHYIHRVRNIKAAAAAVGVSRQHWYRLLRDFRRRIVMAAWQIAESRAAESR